MVAQFFGIQCFFILFRPERNTQCGDDVFYFIIFINFMFLGFFYL